MKTKKTKEAISLIVLVLTIVIMIILGGVIILNLSNSGIIDKANNEVNAANLNEMNELASIGWAISYGKGARTEEALREGVIEYLKSSGIEQDQIDKYRLKVTTKGVTVLINDSPIIPKGAVYYVGVTSTHAGTYTGATKTYTAGEKMPEEAAVGDVYVYDGYEYRYGYESVDSENWTKKVNLKGWAVCYISYSETPKAILESINGAPIVSLAYTFAYRDYITSAPLIPSNVTSLYATFSCCYGIEDLPAGFTIPMGVTTTYAMFEETNISTLPAGFTIPEGIIDISYMFCYTSLKTLPAGFSIPKSVDKMEGTFVGCGSLNGSITIHATPSDYSMCFEETYISEILGDCDEKVKKEMLKESYYDPAEDKGVYEDYTGGLNPSGVIPVGSVYLRPVEVPYYDDLIIELDELETNGEYDVIVYYPGDNFPTPQFGDVFLCNEYRYAYGAEHASAGDDFWEERDNLTGWSVYYEGSDEEPDAFLESINGNVVDSMHAAFNFNEDITTAPTIPSTIKNMGAAFEGCSNLSGTITINTTPTSYYNCLYETQITEILGTCTIKDKLLATK